MSGQQQQGAERDLYRDSYVRYLGECGRDDGPATPPLWENRSRGMPIWSLRKGLTSCTAWAGDWAQEAAKGFSKVTQHSGFSSVRGALLKAQTECVGCPLPRLRTSLGSQRVWTLSSACHFLALPKPQFPLLQKGLNTRHSCRVLILSRLR